MNWKFWRRKELPKGVDPREAQNLREQITWIAERLDGLRFDIAKGIDVGSADSFRRMEERFARDLGRLAAEGIDITSISALRRLEVAVKQLQRRENVRAKGPKAKKRLTS